MAHNILPQHRPHEQLRTEAPSQKKHTDKYVSAYVSSDNFVDMSFTSPLLQESADHYSVGIDELNVNLAHLSILEFDQTGSNVLFEIRRLGYLGHAAAQDGSYPEANPETIDEYLFQNNGLPSLALKNALTFNIDRQYNSIAEVLGRAKEICRALGTFIKTEGLINPVDKTQPQLWNVPIDAGANVDATDFLDVQLTVGGLLKFRGNKIFWSNFVIVFPKPKYQYLLLGEVGYPNFAAFDEGRADASVVLSLHPSTGAIHSPVYNYDADEEDSTPIVFDGWGNIDTSNWDNAANLADFRTFTGGINIIKSLDRLVALEVGCSLPLKNSPMYDHGVESPDFVLGRYYLPSNTETTGFTEETGLSIYSPLGSQRLQGPRDRVCYHHLGPQQKIQQLRLRLWARVRTYDVRNNKWGMKTIQAPVSGSDFWNIKLHFRLK